MYDYGLNCVCKALVGKGLNICAAKIDRGGVIFGVNFPRVRKGVFFYFNGRRQFLDFKDPWKYKWQKNMKSKYCWKTYCAQSRLSLVDGEAKLSWWFFQDWKTQNFNTVKFLWGPTILQIFKCNCIRSKMFQFAVQLVSYVNPDWINEMPRLSCCSFAHGMSLGINDCSFWPSLSPI